MWCNVQWTSTNMLSEFSREPWQPNLAQMYVVSFVWLHHSAFLHGLTLQSVHTKQQLSINQIGSSMCCTILPNQSVRSSNHCLTLTTLTSPATYQVSYITFTKLEWHDMWPNYFCMQDLTQLTTSHYHSLPGTRYTTSYCRDFISKTRLPSNLRQHHMQMHAFSYTRSLPVTWQTWQCYAIWSAVTENPMLHTNIAALCLIERELLLIEALHCGNRNSLPFWLLWPSPWPMTFIYELDP